MHVAMNRAYDLTRDSLRLVLMPEPETPEQPDHNPTLDLVVDRETAEEIRADRNMA